MRQSGKDPHGGHGGHGAHPRGGGFPADSSENRRLLSSGRRSVNLLQDLLTSSRVPREGRCYILPPGSSREKPSHVGGHLFRQGSPQASTSLLPRWKPLIPPPEFFLPKRRSKLERSSAEAGADWTELGYGYRPRLSASWLGFLGMLRQLKDENKRRRVQSETPKKLCG